MKRRTANCAASFLLRLMILTMAASVGLAQGDRQVAAIRADVNAINKNSAKYRRVVRPVEGLSLEGAEAVFFSSGGEVVKAAAKIYGETFRATAELFYKNGDLIFAFQRLEKYDTHVAANPPPKVARVFETRIYYSGGKAIRLVEDRKEVSPLSSDFRAAEQGMNDLSNKVRAAFDR